MIKLQNPQALIDELANYGVTLNPSIEYDPKSSLLEVQAQFNGEEYSPMGAEADFGLFGPLGKMFKKAKKKIAVDFKKQGATDAQVKAFTNLKPKVNVTKSIAGTVSIAAKAGSYIPGLSKLSSVAKGIDKATEIKKAVKSVKSISSFAISTNTNIKGGLAAADKLLGSTKIPIVKKQQVINNTKAMAALGDPDAKRGLLVLNAARKIREVKNIPPGTPANTGIKSAPVTLVKKNYDKSTVYQLAQATTFNTKLGWWPRFRKWIAAKVTPKTT